MLAWTEGRRERGCAYHKKARFVLLTIRGQIDVFVMPKIKRARPIAVTFNMTSMGSQKKRLKDELKDPGDVAHLRSRLGPRLIALGMPSDAASGLVDGVVALVHKDASHILAALVGSTKQSHA
jgi:hypothetical protein